MEDKERFKLTEELKEIFRKSAEFVKKEDYRQVSSEIAIYYLFETYFKDGGGKDEILNEYLSGYNKKDRKLIMEALEAIRDSLLEDYTNPLPDKYKNHPVPVNLICNDLLRRAMMQALLFKTEGFKNMDSIEIDSTMFLLSQLFESDEVTDFLNGFDITKESLTELLIAKGKNQIEDDDSTSMNPVAKLKEKILNNPSAVGESSESDEEAKERMKRDDEEFDKAGKVFENAGGVKDDPEPDPNSSTPYLNKFARDITKDARDGKIDPIIGREKELKQIEEILCCRVKNNCLLIGKSGNGKSSIVSLLAQKIVNGEVPDKLKGKRIFALDLTKSISVGKFRGEFEKVVSNITHEVAANPDIIIYVEEAHMMVTTGSSSDSGGFIDMIKPALARGEMRMIADTTWDDYRKYIEPDKAMIRRFQNVVVDEPSKEDTFQILKGIRDRYSKFHHVNYSDEVLLACVNYSERYLPNLSFPDKAISTLDITGSYAGMNAVKDTELSEDDKKIKELTEKLNKKISEKISYVKEQDFEKAAVCKNEEGEIRKELDKLQKAKSKKDNNPKNWPSVTVDQVIEVIAKQSNVPVDKMKMSNMDKIRELKKQLESKVIGQQEAIDRITLDLQRNILGLRDENKPIASIMALGMTGVGKSLIAKELAKVFFGSEKNLIRINLNELKDKTSIEALLGAKAGYISYGSYEPLLDKVRQNPYCVLLLDEIEKLDPEVWDVFLSILDDGSVKLSNGTDVDFRNCILILTGNIGSKSLSFKGDGLGFTKLSKEDKKSDDKNTVMKELKKTFRPEFINRLSDIIVFNNLGIKELKKIFYLELDKLKNRLQTKNIKISVTDKLRDKIVSECDLKFGARDLQRNIVKYVENEICNALINDSTIEIGGINGVSLDFKDDKVVVSFKKKPVKSKKLIEVKEDSEEKTESVVE